MRNYVMIVLALTVLYACKSSETAASKKSDSKVKEETSTVADLDNTIDLTDHLRKLPGVWVQGTGSQASVRIRGNASIQTSGEPLYIVNGSQITGGYSTVYNMVGNVADIKTIQVLKDASETSFYGVRGSNGVIVIKLK
ncbi:MAG: TonB-dependent receptor plug domain-containing protein [Bacteroidia bacterium]|nr:TonB-dependent receptor plug domain-containing protein [Bacteroidia bacterium]